MKYTNGVKLPAGWWHSVPFPIPSVSKITLYEQIAETNANIVINVTEEVGKPITLQMLQ
uniref:JmjC domain-containing protein n=1 Tax=Heterorhabditis bacteriophora TaxID=37862 RepID=A0A1I7X8N5_HETBA